MVSGGAVELWSGTERAVSATRFARELGGVLELVVEVQQRGRAPCRLCAIHPSSLEAPTCPSFRTGAAQGIRPATISLRPARDVSEDYRQVGLHMQTESTLLRVKRFVALQTN